jgi:flagella basal body P-ring formation protein FlgA
MMRYFALPLLLAAAPALAATSFQDTATIDRAVASFTGRPIGAEGGARSAVDGRLKLAACPMVSLAWRSDSHDAVVVTCSGPDWRLFVPVTAPAVAPAARAAAAPGTPLAKAELVIHRGDPVTIEAGSPGFSITREGIAMGDASAGGRVLVKVEESRVPVQTVAVAGGQVTLPGWNG